MNLTATVPTLVIGLLASWTPVACAANAPIPFLFSQDDQIKQNQQELIDSIESSTTIRDDQWLNGPLTRLDYVLMKIESHLSARGLTGYLKDFAPEYFEPNKLVPLPPAVDVNARYFAKKGRLMIGARISNLGKPKKPMKNYCTSAIAWIELSYPSQADGFAWLNNGLGVLLREEIPLQEHAAIARKLAESAVIVVSVEGTYHIGQDNGFYRVTCMRQRPGGSITFSKYSAKLSNKPR
jgi:hypothetical protein